MKNDVLQSSKSQRYGNYNGLRKRRVGSKTLSPAPQCNEKSIFLRKWSLRGSILEPLEIQSRPKIIFWSIDRHFGRQKCYPKRLPNKNVKHVWKKDTKNDFLCMRLLPDLTDFTGTIWHGLVASGPFRCASAFSCLIGRVACFGSAFFQLALWGNNRLRL